MDHPEVQTPATSNAALASRFNQMFPVLSPGEIDRVRRFGEVRRFPAGDLLFQAGEAYPGMYVILSGRVAVVPHDALGKPVPIDAFAQLIGAPIEEMSEVVPGEVMAEIGQLSGRPDLSVIDARAVDDVEAIFVPPEGLRALLVARGRAWRAHPARAHPPARGADRDGFRRSGHHRLIQVPGCDAAVDLPRAQRDPVPGNRSRRGRRRRVTARTPGTGAGGAADRGPAGRHDAQEPYEAGAGARHRVGSDELSVRAVRRGHRRRGSGRSCDGGLRRLRGLVRRRAGSGRFRRSGRRQRAHRELSGLSHRRLGSGADGTRVHSGTEIRSRVQSVHRGQAGGVHVGKLRS